MPRMHHTSDPETLTDPEKLVDFVKSAVLGQLPNYWETDKTPKQKYSIKIVGEDFEKRIVDSKKDALVLVYHPLKEKNRQLQDSFEEFTRIAKSDSISFARLNGINESQTFKSPNKLPALVYFKHVQSATGGAGHKQMMITFDGMNELLLKNGKEHEVHDQIRQFIHKCQKEEI